MSAGYYKNLISNKLTYIKTKESHIKNICRFYSYCKVNNKRSSVKCKGDNYSCKEYIMLVESIRWKKPEV